MLVVMEKQYSTRDGKEVRLYAVNQGGLFPVHGAIRSTSGYWMVSGWTRDGRYKTDCPSHVHDLVEAPARVRTTAWVSVYKVCGKYTFGIYESSDQSRKANAEDCLAMDCLAIVKVDIDCEQGQGVECDVDQRSPEAWNEG